MHHFDFFDFFFAVGEMALPDERSDGEIRPDRSFTDDAEEKEMMTSA